MDKEQVDILEKISEQLDSLIRAVNKNTALHEKNSRCPSCAGDGKGYNNYRCIPCGGTGVRQTR